MATTNPMTPVEFKLRRDLGTHGDTGVELHAKIDRIKTDTDNILGDTADMQPKLGTFSTGTAAGDLAAIKAVADSTDVYASNIQTLLEDTDYGLDAIDTEVEAIAVELTAVNTKIGTPVTSVSADIAAVKSVSDSVYSDTQNIISTIGTPDNGSVSADIADIASRVDQIQNNTRTTIALLSEMEMPAATETEYYLIQLNNYDSVGAMEAPDSAPTVSVTNFAGTDRSSNLVDDSGITSGTMILDSEGRYHIRYKVTDSHVPNEGLIFSFSITEGGVTRVIDRVARVVEEISSTFTASDRVNLGAILTDTADMQPKLGSPVVDISSDIAGIKAVADAIEVDTTAIEADTQDIQANLDVIKNKDGGATFDRTTDSLEAIGEQLAVIAASASAKKLFRADKTSGSIADGGTELIVLGAVDGVKSPYNVIKEIRVVPTTQTSNNFDVEVFEDSAATLSLMRFEGANASKDDLRLALDLVFVNQDATPGDNIYIKITNNNDSSSSVFNVEVRGEVGNI